MRRRRFAVGNHRSAPCGRFRFEQDYHGISGASGAIFGIRALQMLRELKVETHLVISCAGKLTLTYETAFSVSEVTGAISRWSGMIG